jgi:hypothetical protein
MFLIISISVDCQKSSNSKKVDNIKILKVDTQKTMLIQTNETTYE